MTETPTSVMPCVRGCVTPRAHVLGCSDCWCACHGLEPADHDVASCTTRHQDAGCTGCLPTPAQHGLLCWADWRRLADALGDRESEHGPHGIGWVYQWVKDNREPGSPSRDGMPKAGGHASAPLDLAIVDLITDIEDRIAEHTVHAAGLLGRGLPSITVGGRASWLLAQLDRIVALDMVTGLWDDLLSAPAPPRAESDQDGWLGGLMVRAHVLAPWRATLTKHEAPCPICNTTGSVVTYGGELDPQCRACGALFDAKRWQTWVSWAAAHEKEEQKRAERERVAELAVADPPAPEPVQDDVERDGEQTTTRRRRRTRRSA